MTIFLKTAAGRLGDNRGALALKRGRVASRLIAAVACVVLVSLGATGWRWARAPRVWRPGEAKVAFWTWRAQTPTQSDVERAMRETGARVLFVRAGQFDFAGGRVARIRAVEGALPRGIELHLVYNATPAMLAEFERTDEKALAETFAETFRADSERVAREEEATQTKENVDEGRRVKDEGVRVGNEGSRVAVEGGRVKVSGLQLDLDVPTRLLARYGRVLKETRARLPVGARLSVTGLETWMEAPQLRAVLDAVDFWLPQFYGAEIPASVDKVIPVSSARGVARAVERARKLGKPFYAGLAVYGYAILYSEKGRLLELRGDIAPARVAADRNFELVERRAFEPDAKADGASADAPLASEWRYVFRARDETVLDGLVVRAGEQIVLDVPSSESLRAGVRGVREGAGESLLGICLFRLPTRGDRTTLSLAQIAAALADREAEASTRLSVETARHVGDEEKLHDNGDKKLSNAVERLHGVGDEKLCSGSDEKFYGGDGDDGKLSGQVLFDVENDGAADSLFGDDALALTLRVPRGSVRGVTRLEGFDSFETLCESSAANDKVARDGEWQTAGATSETTGASSETNGGVWQTTLRPCSAARAGLVRLRSRAWGAGARARVGLSFDGDAPAQVSAWVAVRREDGRVWGRLESLSLRGALGR